MGDPKMFYVCRCVEDGDADVLCLACAVGFRARECYLLRDHTGWEAYLCDYCFGHLKEGGMAALHARLQQHHAYHLGKAKILQRNLGKIDAGDGVKILEVGIEPPRFP
jgi:hypothetical protein